MSEAEASSLAGQGTEGVNLLDSQLVKGPQTDPNLQVSGLSKESAENNTHAGGITLIWDSEQQRGHTRLNDDLTRACEIKRRLHLEGAL